MRRLVAAGFVAAALLALPAVAAAGAPNYDCRVARGGRVAIDRWAGVVAATGFAHTPAVWGSATDVRQAGPSLDLAASMDGAAWTVAVRGTGSSVAIARPGGTLAGRCAFVPGNFVLRRADRGGSALRAAPAAHATLRVRIPFGSPVWQDPNRTPRGHWMPVRTTVVRAGALRSIDGWLRQARVEPIPVNRSASN